VVFIEIFPLLAIGWVPKLPIVFVLIRSMSAHKLGILWVSKQTLQSIDHRKVPHHQSRNLFLRIIVYFFLFFAGGF
jgi:hypothetical protein